MSRLRITFTTLLACILLAAATPALDAQVNIEAMRGARGDSGISGRLGLNLLLRTGNVDLVELGLEDRVDYQTARSVSFLLIKGDLGFVGGERFSNNELLHLRHGRRIGSSTTLEAFGQINYDRPRLLDFRVLVGGGLRLGVIDREPVGLWLGIGYMYEHEVLELPPESVHLRRTDVHRASNYLVARFTLGARLALATTGYVQPQLDEFGDIRLLNNTELAVTVTRIVSLVVKFNLRYDSRPPDDITSLDTELRNGLTVAF